MSSSATLIRLDTLGELFETKRGQPRRHARPRGPHIYWTVLRDGDTGRDVVYLAHVGPEHGPHPHGWAWGSTAAHDLVSLEPLHLEPSIGWQTCCGRHGFIREGKWWPTPDSLEPK